MGISFFLRVALFLFDYTATYGGKGFCFQPSAEPTDGYGNA